LENLPPGLKAGKAFGGLLKAREKARLAFERERELVIASASSPMR
jgi:hypothetical protein